MKNLNLNYQKLTREQMKNIGGGGPDCYGFCADDGQSNAGCSSDSGKLCNCTEPIPLQTIDPEGTGSFSLCMDY